MIIIFGAKKFPEIGRSLAEGIHEFKKAGKEAKDGEESNPTETGPNGKK